jgi:hypothetical protein
MKTLMNQRLIWGVVAMVAILPYVPYTGEKTFGVPGFSYCARIAGKY